VAGAGRQDEDVPGVNGDGFSAFAAQHQVCVAGRESENLVSCGVVVVEGVDAITPLWRPFVSGEDALHVRGEIGARWKSASIQKNGESAVRHPTVGFEMKLLWIRWRGVPYLRRKGRVAAQTCCYKRGGELSSIHSTHIDLMTLLLAKLELGATHYEGSEQVEGVGGVALRDFGDLFVDELIGLGGGVAADKGRFEDTQRDVLAG
jgi:hypothetical protein